jgi:DNA polymerase-3 subunit alpha
MDNYTVYHLHSDDSLLDSCTKFNEYVDKAVEIGQTAIGISNHGNIYNWVEKKLYCDKNNIKYLHGVEVYLTETHKEKVRDNYHTVLIAKNYNGILELNSLLSVASTEEDHFYFRPRISFDEFLNISNNIIKISACLASPLNKLKVTHDYYEILVKHYDYLEIQYHDLLEQKQYNQHLCVLSDKYKKPLIAGTDTHSLNKYKAECRSILQLAKGIEFSNEDEFDLTYKSYDELVNAFKSQDAIPEKYYMQAIENTNIMADGVEIFELDKSFKYPKLYENDTEVYHQLIQKKLKDKIVSNVIPSYQIESFGKSIEEENKVFNKIDMCGFMLSMAEFVTWCKEHDIPVGFNRGSCGGSREAYITDITDLNPEQWQTVFSRFANEDRKEIGDIDIDVAPDDREKVYNYIINRFTQPYTAFILALGTVSDKRTIDEIGRALARKWEKNNGNNKENPYSLSIIAKVKKEFDSNPEETKIKYADIFYYYDGLINTTISQSMHPAGIVVSPITLADHYGVFKRDNQVIIQIDMECIHEVSLVKYDILGLKNIGIIRDTYKLIGKQYPKSHEIDWDDQNVWKDILRSPVGIFQFEGEFAHTMLKKYEPKSIYDMSLITAALRPSGASYRDELLKHTIHKNPSPIIDELLKDNNGYLIYQEDTIKFLTNICGLSGSEADNVRRAIGRKDHDRLKKALPQILEGYCSKSSQPREIAEQEAKEFLQIIEDSASYQFGYNHSIGYCMIGYLCAYLRYYNTYEFITSYLNNANNEDDVASGSELANEYGIKIISPKFGLSKAQYIFDKENKVISKGVSSIKFLNSTVADELYNYYKSNPNCKQDKFVNVLKGISESTGINSKQLDILIKLDYFSDYGISKELLRIVDVFEFLKSGQLKQVSSDKLEGAWIGDIIKKYSTNIKKDGKVGKTYTIKDMCSILNECDQYIKQQNIADFNYKEKMTTQLEYLGYIDLTTNRPEDRQKLLVTDVRPLSGQYSSDPWGYALFTKSVGTGKAGRLTVKSKLYSSHPVKKMDIISVQKENMVKNDRGFWDLYKYELVV